VKTARERIENRNARELFNFRVFVIGGGYQYIKMFHDAGFKGASSVADADVLCFTGGEDVSPSIYGEKPLNTTNFNPDRDQYEIDLFIEAVAKDKPMVGICRGGQFLNVMSGGKLFQHVTNHTRTHPVKTFDGRIIPGMTSTHHQMMIPGKDGKVLATAGEATSAQGDGFFIARDKDAHEDTEVVFYSNPATLCFQPHPEFGEGECQDYFWDCFDENILPLL
jgi:GMP synthase-like glutamine amidotransferase